MSTTDVGLSAWEAHTAAEFVTSDVDATMATMTADPVVLHVPTGMGASGYDAVRDFYDQHFVGHQPPDLELSLLYRVADTGGVVDEMLISFTHDVPVPWILPGVAPTGRRVSIGLTAVVRFEQGLVSCEHIYWDQASVLAQCGLLETNGLPVLGAEQADNLSLARTDWRFNTLVS